MGQLILYNYSYFEYGGVSMFLFNIFLFLILLAVGLVLAVYYSIKDIIEGKKEEDND